VSSVGGPAIVAPAISFDCELCHWIRGRGDLGPPLSAAWSAVPDRRRPVPHPVLRRRLPCVGRSAVSVVRRTDTTRLRGRTRYPCLGYSSGTLTYKPILGGPALAGHGSPGGATGRRRCRL